MAKKPKATEVDTNAEVVDELHVAEDGLNYEDVTGKDDLPEGVTDLATEDDEELEQKPVKDVKKAAPVADDIPPELKGKTPAELAKMYREAQQVIGRQGDELGGLRKMADTYIRRGLDRVTKPAAPVKADDDPTKAPDDVDIFTKPGDSISRLIENHPAIKELRGAAKEYATREILRYRTEAKRQFDTDHPDAGEILIDPAFREWIGKSQVRQAMLLRAHQHYDLASGNEVFNTWKELKAARNPVAEDKGKAAGSKKVVRTAAGKEDARVPTGGNASPRISGEGKEGKIYRRADVIKLMTDDPDRYALMSDELTKAYQDGRVR